MILLHEKNGSSKDELNVCVVSFENPIDTKTHPPSFLHGTAINDLKASVSYRYRILTASKKICQGPRIATSTRDGTPK
jgi:hypothetical protein